MDPIIHDGQEYFTGLLLPPPGFSSPLPVYEDAFPQMTLDEIKTKAAATPKRGRQRFDSTWILNQNPKNSCAGHGGAAATAKARVRRGLPPVVLSGAYPYSKANGHRDQGAMLADILEILQKWGCAPLSLVPKDEIYPELQPKNADEEAAKYKADLIMLITTENGLWSALARDQDVVVAVDVESAFMRLNGDGVAGGGSGPGNHCVSADGLYLVHDTLTADGVNSWGTTYGDQGRMGLQWNSHFRSTFKYHQFYCVASTIDLPGGDNPPTA